MNRCYLPIENCAKQKIKNKNDQYAEVRSSGTDGKSTCQVIGYIQCLRIKSDNNNNKNDTEQRYKIIIRDIVGTWYMPRDFLPDVLKNFRRHINYSLLLFGGARTMYKFTVVERKEKCFGRQFVK